jgi:hypothetical protein
MPLSAGFQLGPYGFLSPLGVVGPPALAAVSASASSGEVSS